MDKEFFNITKDLPEVNALLKKSKDLKNELNKVTRRLRTKQIEYDFLQRLVSRSSQHDTLNDVLVSFFKKLGYDVKKLAGKNEEDLQIIGNATLIIIEAKGSIKLNSSYNGSDQILRYITRLKKEITDKTIHGIYIVNHHLEQSDFRKRNRTPFGSDMIKDAEVGQFGLLTTIDLLEGYMKFKTNKISFEEFDRNLKSIGHIKF